jgi:hypothetical protein
LTNGKKGKAGEKMKFLRLNTNEVSRCSISSSSLPNIRASCTESQVIFEKIPINAS